MIVKLKMKKSYKLVLAIILIIWSVLLILGVFYLIYKNVNGRDYDVTVDGYLSINYETGKSFKVKDKETLTFTVMSGSEQILHYNISLSGISDKAEITLYDEFDKKVFKDTIKSGDKDILKNAEIDKEVVKKYKLKVVNKSKSDYVEGNIIIKKVDTVVNNFADTILQNNTPKEYPTTKPGVEASITNEGLIKDQDELGMSYYFRGSVDNNYVDFADNIWRIVRINGDETVRLVLNNISSNVSNFYKDGTTDYKFDSSEMKNNLDVWYRDNLNSYENLISSNHFCNDSTYLNDSLQSYTRLIVNKLPNLNCLGYVYNGNIGLLSADEALLAGGLYQNSNTSYYLYNPSIQEEYFTMTLSNDNNMFMITSSGSINDETSYNLFRNFRPVINLIKNIEVTGDGTINNPYKIK